MKPIVAALVLLAVGLPIIETWEAVFVTLLFLALVFGVSRPGWRRLGVAAVIVIAVAGLKMALPRADIAEAHNAFLVLHDGEALERGLPPAIFRSWKAQFDALYPPVAEQGTDRTQWKGAGAPKALFTASSDAIWRTPRYTRQVDSIGFHTLGEFRGGFANEIQYNFWVGELLREQMPFYVMYELTPASVGSSLVWKGQVFWERADGFDEVMHPEVAARRITPADAGKRVYAAFFPKRDATLDFSMAPAWTLRLAQWVRSLLSFAGALTVVLLTVRLRWPSYLRAVAIFTGGYVFMMAFVAVSLGKYLGRTYPPQGGGDDGLVHDGYGRMMAMMAGRGDVVEALKGIEPSYWFTPGMRYVRMAEKLIFGDTNLLYALLLPCIAIVIFYLIRHLAGTRWAWATTAVFCVIPAGNLSFLAYISNAKLGYGEAAANGFFLLGLALMLRTQPRWGGRERNVAMVAGAGAALAASMFVRPNFAFAVVWLGAAYAWASWKRKDLAGLLALTMGLGLALWLPFHNWFYGGEFYLISKSGATTMVIPLGARDYASALGDLLRGRFHTPAMSVTSHQLQGWLWSPGFLVRAGLMPLAWALHIVALLALVVSCWVTLRWILSGCADGTDLAIVAVASLCAHLPMLFIFSTHFRYAMLAWDLNLIVLIAWVARPASRASVVKSGDDVLLMPVASEAPATR